MKLARFLAQPARGVEDLNYDPARLPLHFVHLPVKLGHFLGLRRGVDNPLWPRIPTQEPLLDKVAKIPRNARPGGNDHPGLTGVQFPLEHVSPDFRSIHLVLLILPLLNLDDGLHDVCEIAPQIAGSLVPEAVPFERRVEAIARQPPVAPLDIPPPCVEPSRITPRGAGGVGPDLKAGCTDRLVESVQAAVLLDEIDA